MKRTLYILLGLIAGICISCKKDEPVIDINTVAPELIGEWHLIEEKCDGEVVKSMADVYLCISDRTFELYQKHKLPQAFTTENVIFSPLTFHSLELSPVPFEISTASTSEAR